MACWVGRLAATLLVMAFGACSPDDAPRLSFGHSSKWIEDHLLNDHVTPILLNGLAENGFYRPLLDFDAILAQRSGLLELTGFNVALHAVEFVVQHIERAPEDGEGGIQHTVNYQGQVREASDRFWEQAELLRGLAHFAHHRGRDDLWPLYRDTWEYVVGNFVDTRYRGWYPAAGRTRGGKGGQWKGGYHVTMMLTEILRLQGVRFRSGDDLLL